MVCSPAVCRGDRSAHFGICGNSRTQCGCGAYSALDDERLDQSSRPARRASVSLSISLSLSACTPPASARGGEERRARRSAQLCEHACRALRERRPHWLLLPGLFSACTRTSAFCIRNVYISRLVVSTTLISRIVFYESHTGDVFSRVVTQ